MLTICHPTTQAVLTTEVHTFGHDGHGSVRVLFDAGSKLAQAYAYAAYGELLAIHNGLGSPHGNAASAALTSMLYNGESFDSRIGQLYLRARWYDGHRFTTIDPYAGDASNPFSFNKYGFVHADPIQGIDPTGMWASLGGLGVGMGMISIMAVALGANPVLAPENANQGYASGDELVANAPFDIGFGIGGVVLGRLVFKPLAKGGLSWVYRQSTGFMSRLAKDSLEEIAQYVWQPMSGITREMLEAMKNTKQIGALGESIATRFLEKNGVLRLKAIQNGSNQGLDVIGWTRDGRLVIYEVKASRFGIPGELKERQRDFPFFVFDVLEQASVRQGRYAGIDEATRLAAEEALEFIERNGINAVEGKLVKVRLFAKELEVEKWHDSI